MQIPKNIRITDTAGKPTAFLSPKADGLKDCHVDTRLNGESTLEFLLPATSEKINELTPECEIWANGRVYNLRKDDAIDTVRDDKNKLWAKVMAVERWSELDTSYVEPSISNDPTARPAADLAVIIVGGGSNLSGGRYATGTAGHALYAVLQGSGWTLGTVDVTGIRDLEVEKASRLSIIKQIQNIWDGYLVWDSVNRIIHLRDAGKWNNYTGFQVRYRKNLKHITRTQSNKLVTKMYAFGHDDLDIANVNGGKKYITNNTYTSREYVGIYKNQDIYDQDELKEKAIAELKLICRPRYLYKVKMVDLRTLPEYSHEVFSLGDMSDIIDPDIAPDSPRPRIIRHKYNLFKPWECELEIGDPEERLIEQLKASFNTTGFIDNKFNGNGNMSGNWLEDGTVGDVKIRSLTADKITAGTIDANIINVKNLKAENITTGYLNADRIKVGSISIGKVDEGFVPGLNLIDNPVFSSYASQVTANKGSIITQATLIQQNASEISLQAISISGINTEIASIKVQSDNISLVVGGYDGSGGLVGDVDGLDYDMYNRYGKISVMDTAIDLRVKEGDIISSINLSPERISINADRIDLRGVTSIYGGRNSQATFDSYGDFYITHNNSTVFEIYNGVDYMDISSFNGTFLRISESMGRTSPRGTWDFSNANVIGL
ncbi:MAG TPA: hypothetical protein GX707_07845 [Epulopiscium sp.]|nr:hypothetical protein [Candidatus Epulonipiscium sp.]